MGSASKSIKLDSPEAEIYLSELLDAMVTHGSQIGESMNEKKIREINDANISTV